MVRYGRRGAFVVNRPTRISLLDYHRHIQQKEDSVDHRKMFASAGHLRRFLENFVRARFCGLEIVLPYIGVYHVNYRCNAACSFCSREKDMVYAQRDDEPDWRGIESILRDMRKLVNGIYFSGGEPLLHQRIEEMLVKARELNFYPIVVNTNAFLLDRHPGVARLADMTVVSLHAADPKKGADIFGVSEDTVERAFRNIVQASAVATACGNRVVANCVLTAESIRDAPGVLDFCLTHRVPLSVVPAIADHAPSIVAANARTKSTYAAFIDRVVCEKRRDPRSIQSSFAFLSRIREMARFKCRPTSILTVTPDGYIRNPCPVKYAYLPNLIGRLGRDSRGVKTVKEMQASSGSFSPCERNCLKACYAEPAIAIESPFTVLSEHLPFLLS